jgi:hypothetical protein
MADKDSRRSTVRPFGERFWKKVIQGDGCWGWTGATTSGYGVVFHSSRPGFRSVLWRAHRVSWELHFGPIPEGLCVLHRCDNPPCCNPAHLFLGTRADNNADMAAKGRKRCGDRRGGNNGHTKLTEAQIPEIREATGTLASIGSRYGVTRATISNIKQRKCWSHV